MNWRTLIKWRVEISFGAFTSDLFFTISSLADSTWRLAYTSAFEEKFWWVLIWDSNLFSNPVIPILDRVLIFSLFRNFHHNRGEKILKSLFLNLVNILYVLGIFEELHRIKVLPSTQPFYFRFFKILKLYLYLLDRFGGILQHSIISSATTFTYLLSIFPRLFIRSQCLSIVLEMLVLNSLIEISYTQWL